ncbi:hypothetical protein E4T66_17800 [Sinimarinibacterium sp. CAU 1509]|uniref:protein-disulfide reductase DsbD domain-containing protein n=1 Tax=Sinimarinibacterium sp. CAU 1509 TaxID=2562283 RepID=UPI0010AB9D08|nr:protein-disulfide reductase DsbD domain-containing protein [Sinimarinibacterium sp. CAU 1509]TJY57262.1 hypothetical protein E4T66_17800 [Sinimarinibacterium sp. CAU 1509]
MLSIVVAAQLMTAIPNAAFTAEVLECSDRARVLIAIAPNYFLAKDSISVRQGGEALTMRMPRAEHAEFAGTSEDVFRRQLYLEAGPLKPGPIELSYQGCDEVALTCLPPVAVTLTC